MYGLLSTSSNQYLLFFSMCISINANLMIRLLLETHTYRESFLENITFRNKEEKIIINMNYLMSNNIIKHR